MKTTQFLKDLVQGGDFTEAQSYCFFQTLLDAPLSQQAAALALLSMRGETADELMGFLSLLQDSAQAISYEEKIQGPVIDMVGTGGDGLKTFNISTASSLVVASAGIKVAKHGSRSVTSLSGSMDVAELLGLPVEQEPKALIENLKHYNFIYLWAPLFNPIIKALAPLRSELGIMTALNILGPLANPLKVRRHVIGVSRIDLLVKIPKILLKQESKHTLVVHSFEGLDELSISGPSHVVEIKEGRTKAFLIRPEDVGLVRAPLKEIIGSGPQENAQIIYDIFSGQDKGARRDIVMLNAAAGFLVADCVKNLREGVDLARQTLEAGRALQLLNSLKGGENVSFPR